MDVCLLILMYIEGDQYFNHPINIFDNWFFTYLWNDFPFLSYQNAQLDTEFQMCKEFE